MPALSQNCDKEGGGSLPYLYHPGIQLAREIRAFQAHEARYEAIRVAREVYQRDARRNITRARTAYNRAVHAADQAYIEATASGA